MNTEEKVIKFITNGSNRSLRRMLEENEIDLRSDTPSTQRVLIAAVKNKNLEVLEVLLEYGIFTGGITIAPGKYGSLFTKAIYEKDTELMGILSKYPHTLNDTCIYDTEPTPLVYALENKLIKLAKKLIKLGANLNVKSEKPLIFYAFDFNDNELLKLMLDNGANPNVLNSSGFTPLSLSVYKNDYAKALMLVKAGANPLKEGPEHKNSFYYAYKSGAMFELLCTLTDYFINLIHERRFDEALAMLDKRVIPRNFTDPRNSKADLVSMAFSTNDPNFIGEILLRIHDPSTASFSNANGDVLYKMCKAKNIEGVRASLKRMGGPEGAKDCWDGNSPIAWSLKHSEYYLTGILIDAGFNPNHPYIRPNGEHEHSLNMAVKAANLNLVKKLIDAGVDTNTFDNQFSPALIAIHYKLRDILHEIRTNVNSNYIPFLYNPKTYELNKTLKKDMENYLLNKKMFELAEAGDFDGVIACLDIENNGVHPLSVNSMNAANCTETLLSVFLGKQRNFDAAERLIKLGAIVSNAYIVENDVSKPLFYYACERKDVELMKFLLSHKVSINEPCSNGYNVLTLAIENNYIGLVRWLSHTKHAADLLHSEIKPHIHLACELGNVSVVRILVEEFHVNVNERVNFGFTPLHIAAKNGFLSIASYLLRHGADPMLKSIDDDEIKNNGSPLDIARLYGNFNVARLILDPREDTLDDLSSSSSSLSLSDSTSGSNLFQELPGEPFEGECSICLEETELVPLSCCGHAFCRDCLNDWFTVQFDGFTRLRCPWNGCNGVCSWYDIIYNVQDKARFEDFYLKKALRGMDDFRWCPKCDSGGFLKCKEGTCLKCGYTFCTECMGEYHTGNCAELYINNNAEFWSNKWIKGNTKACPKCKVLVFKDGGCSHVKCTRCKYEFCWLCLREYTGRYTFDDIDPCEKNNFKKGSETRMDGGLIARHVCDVHKNKRAVVECVKCGCYYCESCHAKNHTEMNGYHSRYIVYKSDFSEYGKIGSSMDKTDSPSVEKRSHISITKRLTQDLIEVYKTRNSKLSYTPTALLTKRVITQPSIPRHNGGLDNENYDLILRVNDVIGSDVSGEGEEWHALKRGSRYRIARMLGKGTFGQVVKCWDEVSHKIVAVKVLKNKLSYHKQGLLEIGILTMINSNCDRDKRHHCLRLLDHFMYNNHLCIVTEYLGINLYELMHNGGFQTLSIDRIQSYLKQILMALSALEAHGIIHCDLKPENVMVDGPKGENVTLIDFGSACLKSNNAFTYIQSRHYRAPEVILESPYSCPIDMWSLGCIAAEFFIGQPLFPGSSSYNQLYKITQFVGDVPETVLVTSRKRASFYNEVKGGFVFKSPKEYEASGIGASDSDDSQDGPGMVDKRYLSMKSIDDLVEMASIRVDPYNPPESSVNEIRESLRDFLRRTLVINPNERMPASLALNHPFITGRRTQYVPTSVPLMIKDRQQDLPVKQVIEGSFTEIYSTFCHYMYDEELLVDPMMGISMVMLETPIIPIRDSTQENRRTVLASAVETKESERKKNLGIVLKRSGKQNELLTRLNIMERDISSKRNVCTDSNLFSGDKAQVVLDAAYPKSTHKPRNHNINIDSFMKELK